jgi:hypothetical protein
MLCNVLLVLDQLVLGLPLQVDALVPGLRQAVDGVHHKVEAVQIVQHRHVERRCDSAFLLITTDVDVVVVGAAVGQPVNQPRVGMEGEDNRFVLCEEFVATLRTSCRLISKAPLMLGTRLAITSSSLDARRGCPAPWAANS